MDRSANEAVSKTLTTFIRISWASCYLDFARIAGLGDGIVRWLDAAAGPDVAVSFYGAPRAGQGCACQGAAADDLVAIGGGGAYFSFTILSA